MKAKLRLGILTSEPENFVPVKLHEEAEAAGLESTILSLAKIIHVEGDKPQIFYEKKPLEVDIIIPRLSEASIEVKLGLLTRLEQQGVKLLNTAASMALCNDKLQSQIKLSDIKLATPWSAVAHSTDELINVVELAEKAELKFPMILKTLRGTHGIGVMKVDSKASLVSVAQALISEGQQLMIQEFIPHKSSYRIIMIGSDLLAANEREQPKDKDEFRTNSHLGSETKRYKPGDEELAFSKKIVEQFGCQFCAIDYIKVGEKFIILEVNGSPGLEAIQKDWEGDLNLPQLVIKHVATMIEPGSSEPSSSDVDDTSAEVDDEPKESEPSSDESKDVDTTPKELAALSEPPEVVTDADAIEIKSDESAEKPESDVISDFEPVTISRLITEPVEARIDTGAKLSSLHAEKVKTENGWVLFSRGSINYRIPLVRTAKIRTAQGGLAERSVVHLDITIKGKLLTKVEFTITDRIDMKYAVLVGRNVLGMLGLPIIVPKTAEPGEGESTVKTDDEEE